MPNVHGFTVLPSLPESLKGLEFLARNMFWCWNLDIVLIFRRIDNKLWRACGYNPVKLLGTVTQDTLETLAANQGFVHEVNRAVDKLEKYLGESTWYDSITGDGPKPTIAYFSAEFGIHECLPIYSGGLGVLSGDHLKSASDLGVPLVGVGLLYQKGYFRQYLSIDGWQQEVYAESDFHNMPIELVRKANGETVRISIEFPGREVHAQVWQVKVGRSKLYLLDSNISPNSFEDRMITANLYGGDRENRIKQEIMLGIGGLRALYAAGEVPTVCHMNEGHAAFMALERIRLMREAKAVTFEEALEATKAANVFTIHTPVAAGNDEFPVDMMRKYFDNYFPKLGINRKQFLGLGRVNPNNMDEGFKMPVLAIRLSSFRNGVSELHGEVSRNMWGGLWPEVPAKEVPIQSITNGVHIKSWLSEEMNELYERYLGAKWSSVILNDSTWEQVEQIPDEELWRIHLRCKEKLISFTRKRLKMQIQRRGTYHSELNWADEVLDPEALTIGFARRFATYKRGQLLLKDPQRLIKLLSNPDKPVQLIFAGKAHPNDTEGKEIIRQIIHFASQCDVRRRIVFLEDYDLNIARFLVRGVDVWLNNPRPPLEASGTSGMKAALNGALNLSTLDGWWREGYDPECGWAIGAGESYDDVNYQDMIESQAIYNVLENEVVPLFYTRSSDNLPRAWLYRMKEAIKRITPRFNTDRMVSEYTEKFYNPAAAKWNYLMDEEMSRVKKLSTWQENVKNVWGQLGIKDVQVRLSDEKNTVHLDSKNPKLKVGSKIKVMALVHLGQIRAEDISVELYHGELDAWGNIKDGDPAAMVFAGTNGEAGTCWFSGEVKCRESGMQGVAVRILPCNKDLANPHEPGLILWESSTSASPERVAAATS